MTPFVWLHKPIESKLTKQYYAAGFLFDLGGTLEWAVVQLLARLVGWEWPKGHTPGKITLQQRLVT